MRNLDQKMKCAFLPPPLKKGIEGDLLSLMLVLWLGGQGQKQIPQSPLCQGGNSKIRASYCLLPNSAVPIRTIVAPSAMASA